MHIGVLGSGTVGKTLAAGFLDRGHHVMVKGSVAPEVIRAARRRSGLPVKFAGPGDSLGPRRTKRQAERKNAS